MRYVPFLYLLRVPLLVEVALLGFLYSAVCTESGRNMLGGMFDLERWAVAVTSALLILLTAAQTIASELVLRYGQSRFRVASLPAWAERMAFSLARHEERRVNLGFKVATACLMVLYLIGALAVLAVLIIKARGAWYFNLSMVLIGTGIAAAIIWISARIWENLPEKIPFLARLYKTKLVEPNGYLKFKKTASGEQYTDERLDGHTFAIVLTTIWLVVYAILGIARGLYLDGDGSFTVPWLLAPALGSALILMTLLCLVLGGLAFWLDRYRVPLIVLLALIAWLSTFAPWSDHQFPTTQRAAHSHKKVTPQDVLNGTQLPDKDGVIVVATSGGGIHAAAWTATVLSQLTRLSATVQTPWGPDAFPRAVRLISSVSGGTVGSLYFTAAYDHGRPDTAKLDEQVITPAMTSSLDDVSWGVAFPDALRTFVPAFPKIDRGWALEKAWSRFGNIQKGLAEWREDVAKGRRPAVIFNSTLVETGGRFVMGTADVELRREGSSVKEESSFYDLFPGFDLPAVTAARLSSSFPYVSPAARLSGEIDEQKAYHVVDGGYYDNYGIMTAAQFLNQGLPCGNIKKVLLIQIDGGDSEKIPQAESPGWFLQTFAPLKTLMQVRGTAQRSRNEFDLRLLKEALQSRGVTLKVARFGYPFEASPLSWHLTEKDKEQIRGEAWACSAEATATVVDFLRSLRRVTESK